MLQAYLLNIKLCKYENRTYFEEIKHLVYSIYQKTKRLAGLKLIYYACLVKYGKWSFGRKYVLL